MKKMRLQVTLASLAILLMGCSQKRQNEENIIKVKTTTVSASSMTGEENYAGTIEEMAGTSLSFANAGTIKVLNIQEGQNVKAGQLIGVLDARDPANGVAISNASVAQARAQLQQARDAYRRMKLLHDNGSLPEIKWVEVETKVSEARQMLNQALASGQIARKGLADTRLMAPFSGYVARKNADVGQNVLPGQSIIQLVKIDQVKVNVSIPEEEIDKIHIGQKVMFKVSSLGDAAFWGRISEKSVSADPISHSYSVKAVVDNPGHRLLPGMVCDVYMATGQQADGMMLPANIIQIAFDNTPFVWIVQNGKAKKVNVVLGNNVGENVVINGGLQIGDQVITEGQQKVCDGMKVKE
jgi:RND family efflux transporter MFP subunit